MDINLELKAEKLIGEYKMINPGDNIIAAFSGGSDSSAMLFFLDKYIKKLFGGGKIYAAHMNHMIRGEEADKDEEFAVKTCEKYGVEIFTEKCSVPEIAKNSKISLEEAAREARYDFLSRTAVKIGGNTKIATAHTASDNTETVIFNIVRGCGIDGLRGIPPVNILNNINIIRPLLMCGKRSILEYCAENGIEYTEDKTNLDENYTRNFIRHSISSKLREKFDGLDSNVFKMSGIMRDNSDFINSCAENIINNNIKDLKIDLNILTSIHKALRHAVIMRMFGNIFSCELNKLKNLNKLEYKHVLYIDELIMRGENKIIDLPCFVQAVISDGGFYFCRNFDRKDSRNRNKK